MADIHIEDFYRDVAKVFLRLYTVFPRKTVLYVEDISGPDQPDEFGLHHPRFEACFSTMVWLAEQGYLRFESTVRQDALDQVVLSQKAFLLLTSHCGLQPQPNSADQHLSESIRQQARSNIARLRVALKKRSSIEINRCVDYLLSQPASAGD